MTQYNKSDEPTAEAVKGKLQLASRAQFKHPDVHTQPNADNTQREGDTSSMNEFSRQELDAKLQLLEERMASRSQLVEGKIDVFLAAQVERDRRVEAQVNSSITLSDEWNQKFRLLSEQAVTAANRADSSAAEAATLKTHFWASVVAQLIGVGAIVVGAYFANQANVFSAISTTISAMQVVKEAPQLPAAPPPPTASPK
jgi:hypothetical protein